MSTFSLPITLTIADVFAAALTVVQLCVLLFAANTLLMRSKNRNIYRPLMLFFLAYAIIQMQTLLEIFDYQRRYMKVHHVGMVFSVYGHLLLAPMLWFYVRAITAAKPMPIARSDWKHFVLIMYGTLLCVILMSTTFEFRGQVFGYVELVEKGSVLILRGAWYLMIVIWAFQVFYYLYKIYRRLIAYRGKLRNIFASTENLEMRWIKVVVLVAVLSMLVSTVEMFFSVSDHFTNITYAVDLLAIWLLALWGLRQKPGLQGFDALLEQDSFEEKYSRSALSKEQMQRIAKKVEAAMAEDALYRDPNLTLPDLAKKVASPLNYVSQTLNGEIGKTYFDYINDWRIEAAKPILLSGKENVTEIAFEVGFNSRSTFYKAFKRITGMTPTAFKKSASQSA